MNYVADTHSLVWYFTEDPRLSKKALDVFEQTKQKDLIIIPTVVLAELMFISQKGKITITFSETLKKIEESENFNVAPLDIEILKVADKMEADIEMHDKLIAATALHFEAALITKDEEIKKLGIVSTVW